MDWKKAVTTLKAHAGVETDKALCDCVKGFHSTNLASVKRGVSTFANIEKLCIAWDATPSQFFAWGEQ